MSHDQVSRPITSLPTTSITQQFPPSVLPQEPQNESKSYLLKEGKTAQVRFFDFLFFLLHTCKLYLLALFHAGRDMYLYSDIKLH